MPEPGQSEAPMPAAGPTGRRRLWAAVTAKPRRGQAVAAVLLALLGYAATVQIQLTHASNDFAGQRRSDLIELLDSIAAASDRSDQEISSLQNTLHDLQSSTSGRAAAIADAQERIADLQILAGTVAATGPGITLTVADPQASVTAASLLNGVEELRDAGAEAMQINHSVRIVSSTWFGGVPGALTVDGHPVRSPYVIDAIGSAHTLSNAVGFPGGLSDQISSLGGSVSVGEADAVRVTALHRAEPPQYAHSSGQ